MAGQNLFDTEGITSYYFLLSALLVYLVPATYYKLKPAYSYAKPKNSGQAFIKVCLRKVNYIKAREGSLRCLSILISSVIF
jgi:preprotein translocase subunit Sec63